MMRRVGRAVRWTLMHALYAVVGLVGGYYLVLVIAHLGGVV